MSATPVTREMLLNVVKVMPAAPQILAQLGELLMDLNSGLNEITELLRRDAGLTTRIIRVANSSFYNQATPASSLVEALARVGFKEVYRLTGFAAVAQISEQRLPLYGVSGAQLRENSLLTALMMETLSETAGVDPRLAYTAGLLRSTGKIALDRLLRAEAATAGLDQPSLPLAQREIDVAGLHNGSAAAIILGEWRFPREMIVTIRDHYLLEKGAGQISRLLNIAAGEAERAGHGLPGESTYWELDPEKLAAAGIDAAGLEAARARALKSFEALRNVVG